MTLSDAADILLVHDNPLEVELMLRALRDMALAPGAAVAVARDGEEALDYLLARGAFRHRLGAPLPRLVLLELKLPKVDGAEVVRVLRASHRTSAVPVVVFVPASEPRELAQCYQLGANSCVHKPIGLPEFRGVIQAVTRYWLGVNQPAGTAADGLAAPAGPAYGRSGSDTIGPPRAS